MSDIAIVQVTCPDRETAESIAQTLLAERLIACANILDCHSVYRWQGE
ncbi:MAG: divalent-cation tolerance protein CutA, partial [Sphingomonadales bacterium]|nr:divalent-cation tolerance protein CutA [Sphingomonadales bacterium]